MTLKTSHKNSASGAEPRLDIRQPVVAGLVVIIVFFGFGITSAAVAPIDKGIGLPGTIIVESKVKPVQHPRGGVVDKIHVIEGQQVSAGDLLVTLDTQAVDEQIAALKAQAEAAQHQLKLIREEAATMAELRERRLASQSRVLALQRQVAEVEKENANLRARIAVAQQELDRAEVRAPVSGRVLALQVHSTGAVLQPGERVLEIVPLEDKLVIEGRLATNQIENVKPGMPAKVWLTGLSWREQRPMDAKLTWVSADSIEDKRTGSPYFVARVELTQAVTSAENSVDLRPGMRSEILLLTGKRTLLDQLIDPLMRNINRAFRG